MEKENKPIKRSAQLAPLSREHHEGLLFGWKIKQGLAFEIPIATLQAFVQWSWQNHFRPHFESEEKILIPLLPEKHPMVLRMQKEHEQIRVLVVALMEKADAAALQSLGDLIKDHIRFEERALFPEAENILSEDQLDQVLTALENQPSPEHTAWTNEFWIKK
ncbi:MAG: hemerythrin domain-containing protein [Chitinophagaceae bacterium]